MKRPGAEEKDAAAARLRGYAAAIIARLSLRGRLFLAHPRTSPTSYRPRTHRCAELIWWGLELTAWMALLIVLLP